MTVLLDYGMGNLRSVANACNYLGHPLSIQNSTEGATKLIIPGVGAFGAAMEHLEQYRDEIHQHVRSGTPILGICLGMQLFFDRSDELGGFAGLGILSGEVRYMSKVSGVKIPHMGWNSLDLQSPSAMMHGVDSGSQVYFVHSLHCVPSEMSITTATAVHGERFVASILKDNIWGTQFHPEKSGEIGLRILRNFLEC
ncbi:MAG: imidazole glycerol phosphate synthase subunit HisH [Armatimonadetes bacterium]|nr:imidazole glycerol phosphate synthase subunit HisH [Armatimonadota bacterium]